LGRWHSVDNNVEDYFHLTPYNYVNNNPVRNIDPDGNDGFDTVTGLGIALLDNVTGLNLRVRYNPTNPEDYNRGQDIGDKVSATAGLYLMVDGGGKAAGGLTLAGGAALLAGPSGGLSSPAVGAGLIIAGEGALEGVAGYALFAKGTENFKNQKGRATEPNPYSKQTNKQLQNSKDSFGKLVNEHKQKLADFKKDPMGKTDPAKLKEAQKGGPEAVNKLIQGRISSLEKQLKKQEGELNKINIELKSRD
jgi:hypothetical protein